MTAIVACALLSAALGVFIFFPQKRATEQREKTRLEYLEEQKTVLYENLRDLRFERASDKYSEEEFERERAKLEAEAAEVVREMDVIHARDGASRRG